MKILKMFPLIFLLKSVWKKVIDWDERKSSLTDRKTMLHLLLVLNAGGQNEAIERNLANKEKQKKQLLERIEEEKKKQASSNNKEPSDEVKALLKYSRQ